MSDQSSETTVQYKSLAFLGYSAYKVGDDGSVWSCWKKGFGGPRIDTKWKRIWPWLSADGRFVICLSSDDHVSSTFYVHRLILFAFIGPCPEGMQCCHYDDNPKNNVLDNLRWDTPKANIADAIRNGVSNRSRKGEENGSAKLCAEQVVEIRELFASGKHSQVSLSAMFGVAQVHISKIVRGQIWPFAGGPIVKVGRGGSKSFRGSKFVKGAE